MIHIILLSGGSGTRLWPLSNGTRSKQFLKVLRDEEGAPLSMAQRVFAQIERAPVEADVTIATTASQSFNIESQLEGSYRLAIEPERRDTAPAILLACADLRFEQGAARDDTVVVMPIDPYVDQAYYDRLVDLDAAVQSDAGSLVLLGVKPSYPSTKYGYICPEEAAEGAVRGAAGNAMSGAAGSEAAGGVKDSAGAEPEEKGPAGCPSVACSQADDTSVARPVTSFREKPDEKAAARLIEAGALWNCGVFAFKLGYALDVLSRYVEVSSLAELTERYAELPKNSFDYEIVEREKSVSVVVYDGAWEDLGTWNTLSDHMVAPFAGRVTADEEHCRNVHVINELGLPVVVSGLEDAIVVATPDGILAASKERSAHIKELVGKAAESRPMYERRRWGEYRVIDSSVYEDGSKALCKELVIASGSQLSYQRHRHRKEVWTIIAGHGQVALDDTVRDVSAGDVVVVEREQMHSIRAIEELRIIEVQLGTSLDEDDIERFGYYWEKS